MAGIKNKYKSWINTLYEKHEVQPFGIGTAFNLIHDKIDSELTLDQTQKKLDYLVKKGWLAHIKKKTYAIVPLGINDERSYTPNSWVLGSSIYEPCYIGGWTSANHFGLTEQLLNATVVITTKHVKKRNQEIKKLSFILRQSSTIKNKELDAIWIEGTKVFISTATQTIVDILNDPSIGGGMVHASSVINNYLNSEHKNINNLIECLKLIENKTVYKRLGYILEKLEIDEKELKEHCERNISKGFSLFDPTMKNFKQDIKYSYKWNLKINIEIKNDLSY